MEAGDGASAGRCRGRDAGSDYGMKAPVNGSIATADHGTRENRP
jgi:hypothetical protein